MSKYIRTKGNTFIEFNYSNERVIDGNKYIMFIRILNDGSEEKYCVPERYIATQADTIEELCDRFVLAGIDIIFINKDHTKYRFEGEYDNECDYEWFDITETEIRVGIYGAIWTDKGLIYVAKMNKEGKLELL